jgi:hypothetical protein
MHTAHPTANESIMTINPSSILTKEDIEKERTPGELSIWWETKSREFDSTSEGDHYALLKKGLARKFFQEILPLNLFANILYAGRSDIGCIPNLKNDNFDAIIRDYSISPPSDLKIEFTLAIDGINDHLWRKYFIEHQHEPVPLTRTISSTGTKKTGYKNVLKNEFSSHYDLLANNFSLIKDRAKQKCEPKKYGKNHILVIIIGDYISREFDHKKDIEALKEFAEDNLINLPLDFKELCILGYSGETFLRFQLG